MVSMALITTDGAVSVCQKIAVQIKTTQNPTANPQPTYSFDCYQVILWPNHDCVKGRMDTAS